MLGIHHEVKRSNLSSNRSTRTRNRLRTTRKLLLRKNDEQRLYLCNLLCLSKYERAFSEKRLQEIFDNTNKYICRCHDGDYNLWYRLAGKSSVKPRKRLPMSIPSPASNLLMLTWKWRSAQRRQQHRPSLASKLPFPSHRS